MGRDGTSPASISYVSSTANLPFTKGIPLKRPLLSATNTKLAILILPTITLGAIFKTFEVLPWWTAVPLAGAEFFGMHHVVSRVLLGAKGSLSGGGEGGITNSPYCAGIILGTMVWLGWTWFTRIVYSMLSPFVRYSWRADGIARYAGLCDC